MVITKEKGSHSFYNYCYERIKRFRRCNDGSFIDLVKCSYRFYFIYMIYVHQFLDCGCIFKYHKEEDITISFHCVEMEIENKEYDNSIVQ